MASTSVFVCGVSHNVDLDVLAQHLDSLVTPSGSGTRKSSPTSTSRGNEFMVSFNYDIPVTLQNDTVDFLGQKLHAFVLPTDIIETVRLRKEWTDNIKLGELYDTSNKSGVRVDTANGIVELHGEMNDVIYVVRDIQSRVIDALTGVAHTRTTGPKGQCNLVKDDTDRVMYDHSKTPTIHLTSRTMKQEYDVPHDEVQGTGEPGNISEESKNVSVHTVVRQTENKTNRCKVYERTAMPLSVDDTSEEDKDTIYSSGSKSSASLEVQRSAGSESSQPAAAVDVGSSTASSHVFHADTTEKKNMRSPDGSASVHVNECSPTHICEAPEKPLMGEFNSSEGDTSKGESSNQKNKDAAHSSAVTGYKLEATTANLLNGKYVPSSQQHERLNVDTTSVHAVNEHKHATACFTERKQDDTVVSPTFPGQNQASSLDSANGELQKYESESVSNVNAAGVTRHVLELNDGNACFKHVGKEAAKHAPADFAERKQDGTIASSTSPEQTQSSSVDSDDGKLQKDEPESASDVNTTGAIPHVSELNEGKVRSRYAGKEAGTITTPSDPANDDRVVTPSIAGATHVTVKPDDDYVNETESAARSSSKRAQNGGHTSSGESELETTGRHIDGSVHNHAPSVMNDPSSSPNHSSGNDNKRSDCCHSADHKTDLTQGQNGETKTEAEPSCQATKETTLTSRPILASDNTGEGFALLATVNDSPDVDTSKTQTGIESINDDGEHHSVQKSHEAGKQDGKTSTNRGKTENLVADSRQDADDVCTSITANSCPRIDPPLSPGTRENGEVSRSVSSSPDKRGCTSEDANSANANNHSNKSFGVNNQNDTAPTVTDLRSDINSTSSSTVSCQPSSSCTANSTTENNIKIPQQTDSHKDSYCVKHTKPSPPQNAQNGETTVSHSSSIPTSLQSGASGTCLIEKTPVDAKPMRMGHDNETTATSQPHNDDRSIHPEETTTADISESQNPRDVRSDVKDRKTHCSESDIGDDVTRRNITNEIEKVTDGKPGSLSDSHPALQNAVLRNFAEFSGECHNKALRRQGTYENSTEDNVTWQIEEPLWEYVISNAETPWSELLNAVYIDDRKEMVELQGKSADIEELKKYCKEERLHRKVVKQVVRVPADFDQRSFETFLRQNSSDKVVVRRTNDSSYCEVIGKGSDIQEVLTLVEDQCPQHDTGKSRLKAQSPETSATKMTFQPCFSSSASSMTTTDSELTTTTPKTNIKVTIETGDILQQRCEVLVSPCNHKVDLSQGLAKLIAAAAGKGLVRECQEYIRDHGSLGVSEVMYTQAGSLRPVRLVIHAHGPHMSDYKDIHSCCNDLERTFLNCLVCASKQKAVSIALPAISSNNGGVPYDIVATAACSALIQFDEVMSKRPPTQRCLNEIKFVNLKENATLSMVDTFKELLAVSTPVRQDTEKHSGQSSTDVSSRQQIDTTSPRSRPNRRKKRDIQPDNPSSVPSPNNSASSSMPPDADDNSCAICMDDVNKPRRLSCGHVFCTDCIERSLKYQNKCPCCGKLFGEMKGDRLRGSKMEVNKERQNLEGYRGCGRIVITYNIPDGKQQAHHPNPGRPYKGAFRTAYLPDNKEGREICSLLRRAFDAGLIFTVGRSTTSGQEDVVTWNDIHHKTKPTGPYGYPDPNYLGRVREELAAKGIT